LRRTPGLTLKLVYPPGTAWLSFADQWDAKSPWHDARVRKAASLAIDRSNINQALTLGYSKLTGSMIPDSFDYYWQPPAPIYDPEKARELLAAAGHRGGFDAGFYYCDSSYANLAEAVINNLGEVGIRIRLMPIERAGFLKGWAEKKYKNLIQAGSGAFGNAATRLAAFVVKGGAYAYGSYPDIDALFARQAADLDRGRRAATLHKIQQLIYERTVVAPIWQLAFINGYGPRVGQSGFGLIPGFAYTGPFEDITIKS
jgi:peptide/nickel transport system substrate-binding protein